eukprot:Platyproteum_vivax@DN16301_c0_g1_i1.p1
MNVKKPDCGKLSLWLTPPKGIFEPIIDKYRINPKEHSIFDPHITLVGSLGHLEIDEVVGRVKNVVEECQHFQVETDYVSTGSTYYQCVYLLMKQSPPLMSLQHKLVDALLGSSSSSPSSYMPHLSLVYGGGGLDCLKAIQNELNGLNPSLLGVVWEANSVEIVNTSPSLESQWETLEVVNFG